MQALAYRIRDPGVRVKSDGGGETARRFTPPGLPKCGSRGVRQSDRVRCRRRRPNHVVDGRRDRRRKLQILLSQPIHQHLEPKRQRRRFPNKGRAQPPANLVTDRAAMRAIDLQLILSAHCRFRKIFCRDNKLQILSDRPGFAAHLSGGNYSALTVFESFGARQRSPFQ